MNSGRLIACLAGWLWLTFALSGCGTFFQSETLVPPSTGGSLSLTVVWTGDRSDPAAPQAVRVTLYRVDRSIGEHVLRRVETPSTSWTTQLESGSYRLHLQVYPNADALGTPIALGEVVVQIVQDTPQRLQIATGGTPSALAILPNPIALSPGQVQPLSVLGVDAQGRYLLLPVGAIVRWSSSDSSVVNVSADGVARALSPGSATVTASVDSLNLSAGAPVTVQTVTREWTILVFMNAANNLEPDSVDDMNEMEQLGSTPDVNIVVQWKRIAGYDSSNGDWRTTRRYYVTKDNDPNTVNSSMLVDMGTGVDMGSPNTLRDFLQWGVRSFPARRYVVVLWNHGSGWRAYRDRWNLLTRGVSFDDSTGNYIRIWELPTALSVGVKWDIIAFDASLMQMLEVAYEIRHLGDYIVGSEESPPAPGYPYHRILAPVVSNPNIATRDFAVQIVMQTLNHYNPDNTDNITQSALDASQIENVARRVDALAITLLQVASEQGAAVRAARENAQAYAEYTYKDLWDYTEQLRARMPSSPQLTEAIDGVQNALSQAVIAEGHSNRRVNRSHGLSIYVPTPSGYETRYGLLAFARATHWDEWLQTQPQ
ncbi:MAG: clostripain-related cysteine peptidase [Armatimonadota bacterium]|nr:clostripain-related cysteine peptidase [Armatimonadota bacterium]